MELTLTAIGRLTYSVLLPSIRQSIMSDEEPDHAHVVMQCIVCKKKLERLYEPTHPNGALCFTGSASYGSIHDQDQQIIGLDYYEIFVCDECWPEARVAAVGVKKAYPARQSHRYFSGEQIQAGFELAHREKRHVQADEMENMKARPREAPS